VNASQPATSMPIRLRMRRLSVTLLWCVATAAALSACDVAVPSATGGMREASTPISRSYIVESRELVEISQFEDGSIKYAPTGLIVVSPVTSATATVGAVRQ
jgi:hypothetical protein